MTDARLRGEEFFEAERGLHAFLSQQLTDGGAPETEARALISIVLGLSIIVLLDQCEVEEAETVLELTIRGHSRWR
ncbi:MAG TPA: hypothetical protein VFI59_13770 [Actinomycetota bacterium]|nr:hypothetical protein [Actinomycetota bacterium]